jgi:hypothetical protein
VLRGSTDRGARLRHRRLHFHQLGSQLRRRPDIPVLTGLGSGVTFGIYAALNAAFLAVTFFFVPETKGVSLEGIEANLMAGKPLRRIGD